LLIDNHNIHHYEARRGSKGWTAAAALDD